MKPHVFFSGKARESRVSIPPQSPPDCGSSNACKICSARPEHDDNAHGVINFCSTSNGAKSKIAVQFFLCCISVLICLVISWVENWWFNEQKIVINGHELWFDQQYWGIASKAMRMKNHMNIKQLIVHIWRGIHWVVSNLGIRTEFHFLIYQKTSPIALDQYPIPSRSRVNIIHKISQKKTHTSKKSSYRPFSPKRHSIFASLHLLHL